MATKYLLSWMAGKNRWRKRYKGRSYYFPKRDDETKEASYRRALLEWTAKRSDIDKVADVDPGTTVLKVLIARAERNMELLRVQDVDTPARRATTSMPMALR